MNWNAAHAPVRGNHEDWKKLAQECAQGAIYDSYERQPHSKCFPDTRINVLKDLKTLAHDGSRKIVWISGESGSGKSTIMHTLADELRQEGTLAGTFFFSRKHAKRSTFERVVFTFAYQLGLQHHIAQEIIMKNIHDDPALLSSEKSRHDQLEKLVIEPLKAVAHIWKDSGGLSLILDALDEGAANGTHHIEPFVHMLPRLINDDSLPIQNIFISSRSWPQIRSAMLSGLLIGIMRVVSLEEYDSRQDVNLYFQHEFQRIYDIHDLSVLCTQPWPSMDDFAMLSERANGRFIFAATIVRLLNQDKPQDRLPLVCNMLRGVVETTWGNIDHLYSSIINSIDITTREAGLEYLRLIVHLAEPISLPDLHHLIGVNVYSFLLPFSALIYVPAPDSLDAVQTFHSSFPEFLKNELRRAGGGSHQVHRPLTTRCFVTMARSLKHDLCELGDPSLLHDEVPDFDKKRDAIPRALRYACCHWLYHFRQCSVGEEIQAQLLDFLEKRVLFAIEAYALLGELHTCVEILRAARKLVMGWSFVRKNDVLDLLYDSWRLTLEFFVPISCSALHVYESALQCCPAKSKLRLTYEHCLTKATIFKVEHGLDDHWDCVTRVISLPQSTSSDRIALSPDGSRVAALIEGDDLNVWDTASGLLVSSLSLAPEHRSCSEIAFNGSVIALRSMWECVLWKLADDTFQHLDIPWSISSELSRGSVAFAGDGTKIALISLCHPGIYHPIEQDENNIQTTIYDVNTGHRVCHCTASPTTSIGRPSNHVSLGFSSDNRSLVVGCITGAFIFDTTSGQLLWHSSFDSVFRGIRCLFSPDGRFLVLVSDHDVKGFYLFDMTQDPGQDIETRRREFYSSRSVASSASPLPSFPARQETSEVNVESLVWNNKLVGVKIGNSIAGIMHSSRTRWKSMDEECYGADTSGGLLSIIDLAHSTLYRSAQLPSWTVPAHGQNYYSSWPVCLSRDADLKAYLSHDLNRYIIASCEHPEAEVILCKIASECRYNPRTVLFSPKATYFAAPCYPEGFKLWSPKTGRLVLDTRISSPTTIIREIHFSQDESMLALQLCALSERRSIIVVYSLDSSKVTQVAQFCLHPSVVPLPASFCQIISVNQDEVDVWYNDVTKASVDHLRWRMKTAAVSLIASSPMLSSRDVVSFLRHSPSLNRLYYRTYSNFWHATDMEGGASFSPELQKEAAYEYDEDNDPDASFDSLSWSDLCLDKHGWLRQRKRRICWLPPRYRPKGEWRQPLELTVEGNKVTILHLRDEKVFTVRLLKTKIHFWG